MQPLLPWGFWLVATLGWAGLSLSLTLGRTTPLTLSRWWLVGLAGILLVSLGVRLVFIAVLRRGIGKSGSPFAAQRLAAVSDVALAVALPLLFLIYVFDNFNHYLSAYPLLKWAAILVPLGAAGVAHEVILMRSAPRWRETVSSLPERKPSIGHFTQNLLAVLLLSGLALLFFSPVFKGSVPIPADLLPYGPPWGGLLTNGPPAVRNPVGSDTLWLVYPLIHFRNLVAPDTLLPLWNPYVFAGTPFLAESGNSQLLQPLHLLLAFVSPDTAVAALSPLYLALTGISMYAFLRLIKLPRGAALVGSVCFMLASAATWWLLASYLQASIVWLLPMALIGAELILRGKHRSGILVSSGVLCLALFGHAQIALYTMLAFGFYAVWMLATGWKRQEIDSRALLVRLGCFAGVALLSLGLAAAQILPALELTGLSHRSAVTGASTILPLPLHRLLTLLLPGIAGYPPDGTTWSFQEPFHNTFYVGILPLALAIWATLIRPNRYVAWGGALTILALFLTLGWPNARLLATFIPSYQIFPNLSRFLFLGEFGVSLLAAFGAAALLRNARWNPHLLLRYFGLVIAFLLLSAAVAFIAHEWPPETAASLSRAHAALRDSVRWFAVMALASGCAILIVRQWGKYMPYGGVVLLGTVAIFDLAGYAGPLYTYAPRESLFPPTPMTSFLQEQQEERLFRVVGVPLTTFLPNSAMVYGLADARGYSALYPGRILQYAQLAEGRGPDTAPSVAVETPKRYVVAHRINFDTLHDVRLLSLLNVEYIVLDKQYQPTPPLDLSQLEFVMEQPGLRGGVLYRNPNVLPRAFLVGEVSSVGDSQEAAKRLQDPKFDPSQELVLESDEALPSYPPPRDGSVAIESYAPERVHIRVQTNEPAWLLLTDTFYPGWRATINGDETTIYAANLLFRAVTVPEGVSVVEFSYEPASWRWGVRISLAALLVWLVVLLLPIYRRITELRLVRQAKKQLPSSP